MYQFLYQMFGAVSIALLFSWADDIAENNHFYGFLFRLIPIYICVLLIGFWYSNK